MSSPSLVWWDPSHSHMLSSKAILEGWDTFFWIGEPLVNFGNLAIGMNTKRFELTTAEVFKWLGLLIHNNPDARVEVVPCEVKDIGILSYLPVKDKPETWDNKLGTDSDLEQLWKPGNFRLVDPDPYGHYGGLSAAGAKTIEQWEQKLGSYITLNRPLDSHSTVPQNTITLPSTLVNEFKRNNFTVDIFRKNRIITFPKISAESEAFLDACSLTLEPSNIPFVQTHFRLCLWVHCLDGNVYPEYAAEIDERVELIEEEGVTMDDNDPLNVALRRWYLSQAMDDLQGSDNSGEEQGEE
ncbi:hypothetical protein VNI00_018979 [Paramarasmius palmivorus]|uniref:Uncharacterized protein n=1 Tax=Paramarasmius palmivorus TaxID=297713 RepID=A0AAW0AVR0_9AGAR